MRRPTLVTLALLAVAGSLLAGCRKADGTAEAKTLVCGTTETVTDLDPSQAYDFHTMELLQSVHRGLTAYEPGTGRVVPALAESYTANDAGDVFTFKLRRNVAFADGTALNAAAVKATIDRAARLEGDASWLITEFVRQVDAVDERTVRFTLKGPTAFFPALVASTPYFPMRPSAYPADRIVHDPEELAGGALTGLGPYSVVSFKRGQEIVLEANRGYRGVRPGIGRIAIRSFSDSVAMRLALERGEIDVAFRTLGPADVGDLAARPGLVDHRVKGPQIRYLCFETSRSVFRDKRVRQAVAALVDRREIVERVHLGLNTPLYSMVPDGVAYHIPAFKQTYGEWPDTARADDLLAAAGYTAEAPLRFQLWHSPQRYGGGETSVAEALKAQLERSRAISVEVRGADWVTFKDQWGRAEMPAWLLGWYPDYLDADNYTAAFAQTSDSRSVGINFSNAEWDRWFAGERRSLDPAMRRQIFETLQEAWTDEVPTLPLWQGDLHIFSKSSVRNVKVAFPLSLDYASLGLE